MELIFNYNINKTCEVIIREKMDFLDVEYDYTGFAEVKLKEKISDETKDVLKKQLEHYGIQVVSDKKEVLVQKIKNILIELTHVDEGDLINKTSVHLSEKLDLSYGYLANVFAEITMSTIANFIILQKIERSKILLAQEELSFSEIAYKLKYSSIAHFSNQFKQKTGLTPSAFQRILRKRKDIKNNQNSNFFL